MCNPKTTSMNQLAGLTLQQAVDLKQYLKATYGIDQSPGGSVIILTGETGGVAFSTSDPSTVSDLNRLQGCLQTARRDGNGELAGMAERTLLDLATSDAEDFDRPL